MNPNETMRHKLRGHIGSQRQRDNAETNARILSDNATKARHRETRLREILDEAGYFDSLRSSAERYSLHAAAVAKLQDEERRSLENQRAEENRDIVQRHLEAQASNAGPLQELRDEVKARGHVTTADKIRFQHLTRLAIRRGVTVEPLEP